jgi:hypothetical protein
VDDDVSPLIDRSLEVRGVKMIRKEKQNHLKWQNKTLYILLALGIVLWSSSVANGKPRPIKKTPSSKTLRSMARVYMAYGEYAKAQPLAEKALTSAKREHSSDYELAMCLIDLATLYKNQGMPKKCVSRVCAFRKSSSIKTILTWHIH